VNDVGKPCAREPHARFERGPLGRLTHVAGTAGLGSVRWKATTMARSRPELQQWFAEPVAYLTAKGFDGPTAFRPCKGYASECDAIYDLGNA
jgi:hypothetical protein